jgi:trigger factor
MQATEQTNGALERRIDMAVPLAAIERDVEERLKRLARTVKMSGFRPGKVPFKMVAAQYGSQVRSEAVGDAINKAFGEKIREQNLRVAGYPRIEQKHGSDTEKLEFSAVFEVYPEIALGDISEKPIENPVLVVGDVEVDKTIEVLRKQRQVFEKVERAAQLGDQVVVDFTGRRDGEIFQGGTATDFGFVIGTGQMLKEFEESVAGMSIGASKTFDLTFPEDYHADDLKGKKAQFEVTLKEVREAHLPALDAGFARALGVADGDLVKMRSEVKANLEREVKKRIAARLKDQVMNVLLEVNPIEVPKSLIELEARQMAENARQDMSGRGMDVSKVPVETSWFADQAERRVKLGLLLAELVKRHDLHAKAEQIRAQVEEFSQSYEDPAEVVRWYYGESQRMAQVEALVVEDNVVAWTLAHAQSSDKPVSFDELMGGAT